MSDLRARKRRDERVDSVDETILADREVHRLRIEDADIDGDVIDGQRTMPRRTRRAAPPRATATATSPSRSGRGFTSGD